MRDLKRVVSILGGLTVGGALMAAGLVACSDDTSVAGGEDASLDVSTDTGRDAGPSNDTGTDAVADAAPDAPPLEQLPPAIGMAICTRILTCCGGTLDAGATDAGVFDMAKCLGVYAGRGWDNSLLGVSLPGVADGGHVVYDPTAANDCLTRINNGGTADAGKFTCQTMQAAELKSISTACFAAAKGNIPIAKAGCRATIECVPGSYCGTPDGGPPGDGGTGTCTALKSIGANCDDSAPLYGEFSNDQCSYRGSGVGCFSLDAGPRTCVALQPDGVACVASNEECQSGLCDDNGNCGASVTFIPPSVCSTYITP